MPEEEIISPIQTVDNSGDNLEDTFQQLFKTSASGTGEEELLRIASTYSRQLNARQIKAILFLEWQIPMLPDTEKDRIRHFVNRWLELKQYNNSDIFVMKALEHIALRKFIGENSVKVNIEK